MTTYVLNTKQFCPHRWIVKQLCNHTLAFYTAIQRSVAIRALVESLLAVNDNGTFTDAD